MAEKTKKRGLGKGLEALIPKSALLEREKEGNNLKAAHEIEIHKIHPNPHQPRKEFSKESLEELMTSIKKHGVLQPILVTKNENRKDTFVIIAGERRWRACKNLQIKKVPVLIKDFTEQELLEVALVENLQRENLNGIEEGKAYQHLIQNYNLTANEVGEALGKSRSYITNILRLLKLDPQVQQMVAEDRITSGHGRALLSLKEHKHQLDWALKIEKEGLTVRQIEKFMQEASAKKPRKPGKKEKNVEITSIEEELKSYFGTKVNIITGRKKGKLEIEYYNPQDLERIVGLLKGE
jgi:ParB family transcriptional regulator, chromosome partitioning protein